MHRIGRTGRAGNTGVAVTFVDWDDLHRWTLINKALDLGIPEPEETYSSSEHLYEELDIPREAKGRLPKAQQTRAGLAAETLEDLGETGKSAGRGQSHGRGRDSGGRDNGGRGGQSGRGERSARGTDRTTDEGPSRPRRNRSRRRTRGGQGSPENA